jgi:hypothetical protein
VHPLRVEAIQRRPSGTWQTSTRWRRDSQWAREELAKLIEGRLSTAPAKDELVRLATRVIVDEALEGEAGDAVGREYYAHGAQPGQGYRNGCCTGRLKTTKGLMEYSAPQIARIWPSRCWRALSVRDIEDALMGAS